jgi:hypothetical protein
MQHLNTSDPIDAASRRHLEENASECAHRNLIIRVDALNLDQTVAYCSVAQRTHGLLRRTYSRTELVWRAEQALAPMIGWGIVPLINAHMASDARPQGAKRGRRSLFDRVRRSWWPSRPA